MEVNHKLPDSPPVRRCTRSIENEEATPYSGDSLLVPDSGDFVIWPLTPSGENVYCNGIIPTPRAGVSS